MNSKSEKLRSDGNKIYIECDHSLPPVVYISRLQKALDLYCAALRVASNSEEKASAWKNIGKTYSKLIIKETLQSTIIFYYEKSLEAFSQSLRLGREAKGELWTQSMITETVVMTAKALEYVETFCDMSERLKFVYRIKNHMKPNLEIVQTKIIQNLIRANLRWGLSFFQTGDYKKALGIFCDGVQYVEEGLYLCKKGFSSMTLCGLDLADEFEEKKEAYLFQTRRTEAMLAFSKANSLFETSVFDEESLSMDLLWEALDYYKFANTLCKEKDLEIEAQVHGKIGYVYDKILKMRKKAKEFYVSSIKLALSLGRSLVGVKWYEDAMACLQAIRDAEQAEEDNQDEKKRAKLLEKFGDELQELEKAKNKSHQDFLKYIVEKYAPENHNLKLDESTLLVENMRKTILKAIRVFHPDKVANKEMQKECFFAEEITKILNLIYCHYK